MKQTLNLKYDVEFEYAYGQTPSMDVIQKTIKAFLNDKGTVTNSFPFEKMDLTAEFIIKNGHRSNDFRGFSRKDNLPSWDDVHEDMLELSKLLPDLVFLLEIECSIGPFNFPACKMNYYDGMYREAELIEPEYDSAAFASQITRKD